MVRTFPYGVPERTIRCGMSRGDFCRRIPFRNRFPRYSLRIPYRQPTFMDPSVSFPLPVLRSLAAYPLLSVSGIRC